MIRLPQNVIQTKFIKVTSDTTTTSNTLVDLLSLSITITSPIIWIFASYNILGLPSGSTNPVQLNIDGSLAVKAVDQSIGVVGYSIPIVYRKTGLSVGSHTIAMQWAADPGVTMTCRPVTAAPGSESAALLIMEVKV